jgi:dTDP-4-amino-4,6-dideoxygalactose transaminase
VFVDIRPDTLNLDETLIRRAITPRTRAVMTVHYAGVACEMDSILALTREYDLELIEDAAQGVNAFYHGRAIGSIGALAAFSFHETKNYIAGQAGALCINSPRFLERAEIIRDKGTNRQQFLRGEVNRYSWVELGTGGTASELTCAFLYAQLEEMDAILQRRQRAWHYYYDQLSQLRGEARLTLPTIPPGCESNYHVFYILLDDPDVRDALIRHMHDRGVQVVFHYTPLHSSPMGKKIGGHQSFLPITEDVSRRLLRLPLFDGISQQQQQEVCGHLCGFFKLRRPRNQMWSTGVASV